ncbi:GDSL-type esterase/lipase family protein [Roseateles sp.]|uniref:GDSL-type esterase/lipase family protein n=1 Tax=Roseateles sp. TaxID=1971397 RepID=UPI0039EC1B82
MSRQLRTAALAALLGLAATLACAGDADDWAQLGRYRSANATLQARPADAARVVFMGDSITEGWGEQPAGPFTDSHHVNRGISGQTTAQMLLRFRPDVLALKPRLVVLLAGTNDIAGNTGPMSPEAIAGNVRSMVQLARAEGVAVVLCAVLPVKRYPWAPDIQPAPQVVALNRLLHALAREYRTGWVDYHAALVDRDGGLPTAYSGDGVHPNAAGYAVMRKLIEPALREQRHD